MDETDMTNSLKQTRTNGSPTATTSNRPDTNIVIRTHNYGNDTGVPGSLRKLLTLLVTPLGPDNKTYDYLLYLMDHPP